MAVSRFGGVEALVASGISRRNLKVSMPGCSAAFLVTMRLLLYVCDSTARKNPKMKQHTICSSPFKMPGLLILNASYH